MRKGLTEIVFILDRSGSMGGKESDTINGFNALIKKQKAMDGDAYVSAVLFDDVSEVLFDRVYIRNAEPIGPRQYYVRGCTALLDAIGDAVNHIENVHRYAREEDRPEKTIFMITTDGLENASCRYSFPEIRELIARQQELYGWEFLFIGAGIDAIASAASMGISADKAARCKSSKRGIRSSYDAMCDAVCEMRRYKKVSSDWADKIVDDDDDDDTDDDGNA